VLSLIEIKIYQKLSEGIIFEIEVGFPLMRARKKSKVAFLDWGRGHREIRRMAMAATAQRRHPRVEQKEG